jgi:hypothetical protein
VDLALTVNYIILADTNDDEHALYWSNEFGWAGWSDATSFTDEERATVHLPIGGEWVSAH